MKRIPSCWKFSPARLALLLAILAVPPAVYGGSNSVVPDGPFAGQPFHWPPNTPIPYQVNPGGVAGLTGELQRLLVQGAVNDAFRAWTLIPGATVLFEDQGVSSVTEAVIDGVNLVTFQDTSIPLPPGVLGLASVVFASQPGLTTVGPNQVEAQFAGQILEADIIFNRTAGDFSPIGIDGRVDIVAVGLHEIGHLLGLGHTGIFSSIMNPFSESGTGVASRTIQSDDAIPVAVLYPIQTFAADRGTISGTITTSAGAPVKTAHAVAVSVPGGVPVASQLSGPDGRFVIAGLPPGTYQLFVEPLDGPIGQSDFPGFYFDGLFNFASAFLGGSASPTPLVVTAGLETANANVQLPATPANLLNISQLGIITTTPTGSLFNFGFSPLFLPRGRSYQIFVTAANQGTDSNLTFSSPDIAAQGTTADSLPGGQPIRRQDITISAAATLGPSNILLSNASSRSAMPGGLIVTLNPNLGTPLLDGAGFGTRLAPGAFISIFGTDLAQGPGPGGIDQPVSIPLPTTLGGVSVKIGDRFAPLFFVSPTQINALIPFELTGSTADVTVVTGPGAAGNPVTINLNQTAPGIFVVNAATGQGAILLANSDVLAAPAGSIPGRQTQPVGRGEFITIFCSGLGPVTNPPPSGLAASGTPPLSETTLTPTVTIGGTPATVSFSGLAPFFVGLYQINVQVPADAPTGDAVPVTVSIGGAISNTANIAIQ